MKHLKSVLSASAIAYLLVVFITWDFNPAAWHDLYRAAVVLIVMFFLATKDVGNK